jgi:hypothetical protein
MKGGENLGLNNSDLGNIILSLTNFDFYIKLQANNGVKVQPSDADGEIYYFVFDLTDNNFVTEYGLFKDLLLNGNKPTILSKTFSEMKDGAQGTEVKLEGKAYKQSATNKLSSATNKASTSNVNFVDSKGNLGQISKPNSATNKPSTSTVKFNEEEGLKSTLQININPSYVPFYKLTINGATPVNNAFTASKQAKILTDDSSLDTECTLENIIQKFNGLTALKTELQPYDESNEANKNKLYKLLSLEDETIKCINYALNKNIKIFNSSPDVQIPDITNIVTNLKTLYNLLINNFKNFLFINSNYQINKYDNGSVVESNRFDLTTDKYQNAISLIIRFFKLLKNKTAIYPGIDFTLEDIPAGFSTSLNKSYSEDKTYLPEPKKLLDKDETSAAKAAAAKAATAASSAANDSSAAAAGPENPQGVFERFFNNLVKKIKNGLTNQEDFDTKIKPWVFTIYRQTSTAPLQNISMRENYSMVFVSKLTQFINDNEQKIKNNQITSTDVSALSKEINDSTNPSSLDASPNASTENAQNEIQPAANESQIPSMETQPLAAEVPQINYRDNILLNDSVINSMVAHFFTVPIGNVSDINIQTQIYVLKSQFKDFLNQESVSINEEYFNDCFDKLQTFILSNTKIYYANNSKNKNFINSVLNHIYLNLRNDITSALNLNKIYRQTQSGGLGPFGATTFDPNCKAIIELSSESLNISDFAEPIIYLNKSDAKFGNVVKFNTLPGAPIFPYLTVGKPLLQKLNDLTANYNSKFEVPPPFSKKVTNAIISWIMQNKLLTLSGVTFLANKAQNYLIEKGAQNPDSWYASLFKDQTGIKRVITDLLNKVFGDWQKIPIFGTFISSCITMFTYILSHPGFSAPKLDENNIPIVVNGVAQMWTSKDIPDSIRESTTTLPEFLKWVSEKNVAAKAAKTASDALNNFRPESGDSLGGSYKKNKNTRKRTNRKNKKTLKRKVKKNRKITKKNRKRRTKKN